MHEEYPVHDCIIHKGIVFWAKTIASNRILRHIAWWMVESKVCCGVCSEQVSEQAKVVRNCMPWNHQPNENKVHEKQQHILISPYCFFFLLKFAHYHHSYQMVFLRFTRQHFSFNWIYLSISFLINSLHACARKSSSFRRLIWMSSRLVYIFLSLSHTFLVSIVLICFLLFLCEVNTHVQNQYGRNLLSHLMKW